MWGIPLYDGATTYSGLAKSTVKGLRLDLVTNLGGDLYIAVNTYSPCTFGLTYVYYSRINALQKFNWWCHHFISCLILLVTIYYDFAMVMRSTTGPLPNFRHNTSWRFILNRLKIDFETISFENIYRLLFMFAVFCLSRGIHVSILVELVEVFFHHS